MIAPKTLPKPQRLKTDDKQKKGIDTEQKDKPQTDKPKEEKDEKAEDQKSVSVHDRINQFAQQKDKKPSGVLERISKVGGQRILPFAVEPSKTTSKQPEKQPDKKSKPIPKEPKELSTPTSKEPVKQPAKQPEAKKEGKKDLDEDSDSTLSISSVSSDEEEPITPISDTHVSPLSKLPIKTEAEVTSEQYVSEQGRDDSVFTSDVSMEEDKSSLKNKMLTGKRESSIRDEDSKSCNAMQPF